ncbi:MAG TPA: shikimate dehydrogenase family protein [Desulfobacterales bacterium]
MKVYCILSDERAPNLRSPSIFSTVMKSQGIRATYVPFTVRPKDLGRALDGMRVLNIAGANVTVPYKEAVVPFMDCLSEGANIIGSVNTIVRDGDRFKGYNTNAIGIMDALGEAGFEVDGCSALVLGTGGVGRAVVFVLNWLRAARIFVAGRSRDKAAKLVTSFSGEPVAIDSLADRPWPVDIVVNATSVSSPDESPAMAALARQLQLPECRLVFDLNYGRRENFWQMLAADRQIAFVDGLSALAYQARRTFALWTGLQVPPEEFLRALKNGMDA